MFRKGLPESHGGGHIQDDPTLLVQSDHNIVQELVLPRGPVHQLVDTNSEAVPAWPALLVYSELAGEYLVPQRHLGHVEPESSGELQLLLVPVIHEAHDDVALVDGLKVLVLDQELTVGQTVEGLESEILQLSGVSRLVEQRQVNVLHEGRHRRVVRHPPSARVTVGPVVEA